MLLEYIRLRYTAAMEVGSQQTFGEMPINYRLEWLLYIGHPVSRYQSYDRHTRRSPTLLRYASLKSPLRTT